MLASTVTTDTLVLIGRALYLSMVIGKNVLKLPRIKVALTT
jgi:hypothetical protein